MEIKGFWHIFAQANGGKDGAMISSCVIKARNIKKAIKIFYSKDLNWYLKNNYKVISIKPLSVKVFEENEN